MASSHSCSDVKTYPKRHRDQAKSHTETKGPRIKPFSPNKRFIRDTNQQILVLEGSTLVAVPDKRGKRGEAIWSDVRLSDYLFNLWELNSRELAKLQYNHKSFSGAPGLLERGKAPKILVFSGEGGTSSMSRWEEERTQGVWSRWQAESAFGTPEGCNMALVTQWAFQSEDIQLQMLSRVRRRENLI
ncbi:hypothetical protein HispidOSU_025908 [Sigmodon hispidus]